MFPKLIIFDVDDTLTIRYQDKMRHFAEGFFSGVGRQVACKFALATNQGGVGLRYWMETADFGRPQDRPTAEMVEGRIQRLTLRIAQLSGKEVRAYISFAYQGKRSRKYGPTPPGFENDPRWLAAWRKPQPGMLLTAAADAGAEPGQCLFVGAKMWDTDHMAARAAGMDFVEAAHFFQNIEKILTEYKGLAYPKGKGEIGGLS